MIDKMTLLQLELDMRNPPATRQTQLQALLEVAAEKLEGHGINLDPSSVGDMNLQVQYAAWMYRRRNGGSSAMPEYLKDDIHDRLVAEKAR